MNKLVHNVHKKMSPLVITYVYSPNLFEIIPDQNHSQTDMVQMYKCPFLQLPCSFAFINPAQTKNTKGFCHESFDIMLFVFFSLLFLIITLFSFRMFLKIRGEIRRFGPSCLLYTYCSVQLRAPVRCPAFSSCLLLYNLFCSPNNLVVLFSSVNSLHKTPRALLKLES